METTFGPVRHEWAVEMTATLTDAPTVDKQALESWSKPGTMTVERVRVRWYHLGESPDRPATLSARVFGHNVRKDGKIGAPTQVGVYGMDSVPEWLREVLTELRHRAELVMAKRNVVL